MPARVTAVYPPCAIEGGRIAIRGTGFPVGGPALPEVRVGALAARIVHASAEEISLIVPEGLDGGRTAIHLAAAAADDASVDIAAPLARGLHQVDNPLFDRDGNLYVTFSGTRGQQVPVSIFRVRANGTREPFSSGIVNATSMAMDPQGRLYVSSRFEGTVYRVLPDGTFETFATDLGIACGLAFDREGILYVGDRSGTLFRVNAAGKAQPLATL